MNNVSANKYWLSGDITARFEPPPITSIKMEHIGFKIYGDYFNVHIFRNHASTTSKIYEVKLEFFENG